MSFALKELDGELGDTIEQLKDTLNLILVDKEEKDYETWLEPDYLHIEDLRLNVYCGYYMIYDDEFQDYDTADLIYVFYDDKTGKEVYSEMGSSLWACIYNLCWQSGMRKSGEEIDNLSCTFRLDNGDFLRKKVLKMKNFDIAEETGAWGDFKDTFR